jgi:hypothetical protein
VARVSRSVIWEAFNVEILDGKEVWAVGWLNRPGLSYCWERGSQLLADKLEEALIKCFDA